MYTGLGGAPLPAANPTLEPALAAKFAQYNDPAAQGATLGPEGLAFLEAIAQGFVSRTQQGLATFLSWSQRSTGELLAAGLWDWFAFRTRIISKIPAGNLPNLARNLLPYPEAIKALEVQYAIPITPLAPAPSTRVPTVTTPRAVVYSPGLQICVDYRSPPSPGDGINFATVCWRSIDQGDDASWRGASAWVRWTDDFVHRTNDQRVVILEVNGVVQEAAARPDIWDRPSLLAAINGVGTGSPPPTLGNLVITPRNQVKPTIPSGSIPIPDGPTVRDWIDATVPDPGVTKLPTGSDPGPAGGTPTTGRPDAIIGTITPRPGVTFPADGASAGSGSPGLGKSMVYGALTVAAVWFLSGGRKGRNR